MKTIAIGFVLLGLASCRATASETPAENPNLPPDRLGLSTDIGKACARLQELKCPEGNDTKSGKTCYETLRARDHLLPVPAQCVKDAATIELVRACGGPETLRFRCQREAL